MTHEELKHIENYLPEINMWIETHAILQVSDTLKPIFTAYETETGFSTTACNDCKIDALIWARAALKKSKEDQPTSDKPKKSKHV